MVGSAALAVLALALLFRAGSVGESIRSIASPETWRYNWIRMTEGPKWEAHEHVLLRGSDYLRYPWLGAGPGNYTSNIAFLTGRPLARLPHLFYRYIALDRREVSMGGSVLTTTRTGVLALWGEMGPLGVLLFWGMYVYAVIRVWRQCRAGVYRDPYRRILAEAFVPAMSGFIILNVLTELVPLAQLNIGIWIWAATVWNPPDIEEQPAQEETPGGRHV
jgi:hypothetical protein